MTSVSIRELQESDFEKGFIDTLDEFRPVKGLEYNKLKNILNEIEKNKHHKILVAVKDDLVVASFTIIIEKKFIHNGGAVAHLEDLVVREKYRGQHISEKLFEKSMEFANQFQCYKVITNCNDNIKPLWEKYGFRRYENSMRLDL